MTRTEKLKLEPTKYAAFRARRNLERKQRYHNDEEYRLSESARKSIYYEINSDKVDAKNADWIKNHSEERKLITRTSAKKRRHELREEFIAANGNRCVCCAESNVEFLTLDHIEQPKQRSGNPYLQAKREQLETQLLCMGCNLAKGIYGTCPHLRRPNDQSYHFKLKLKVIEEYGDQCGCCGEVDPYFLVIDHINGGGTAHRKEVKSIIRWLYDNDFPKDGFRLLCTNCNHSLGIYGYCPHQN